MLHQRRLRCVATDEICVKEVRGFYPRQAIYESLRQAGAYKFCTSGYRRALLAKYVSLLKYSLAFRYFREPLI